MSTEAISVLRSDPNLQPVIEEHGELTLEPAEDTFERLVVSIIRQQVSMASARAIEERVFDRFEITPEAIIATEQELLKDAGLSGSKAEYIQNIAEAYLEYEYGHEYFAGMDNDAVVSKLTSIRGVGEWTGKMFLMFSLGREDVFPVEDLGIRKGMWELFNEDIDRTEMYEIAEQWKPYRSYASLYLWRAYEG